MNFQVTVLKILVSYPDGFAVMADLKRDMAILGTSGRDWAERTKRLAARVPDLDIFSQALVERLNGGWRITEKGRTVLEFMEAKVLGTTNRTEGSGRAALNRGARAEAPRRHTSRPKPAPATPPRGTCAGTRKGVLNTSSRDREKSETFRSASELAANGFGPRRAIMVDEVVLKNATETAWTVYRARHPDVGAHDDRLCLLERLLHGRWQERESDTEELASFGIAYLLRRPKDEC